MVNPARLPTRVTDFTVWASFLGSRQIFRIAVAPMDQGCA